MSDRLKDAFDKVRAEDELKKSTREFLAVRTQGYKKHRAFQHSRLLAAMACLVLAVLCGGGCFTYFTPISAISVDVNPSFELKLNRFDKVISIKGYNEEGRALAESLDIKFLNYTDALDRILDSKSMEEYLSKNAVVSITVVGKDGKKSREIFAGVKSCAGSEHRNVHCYSGDAEEVEAAHESGLSFGKYQAFLKLQELDPSITAEDVQGLTMREIRNRISELSGSLDSGEDQENESGYENGNGHGDGHRNGNGSCSR